MSITLTLSEGDSLEERLRIEATRQGQEVAELITIWLRDRFSVEPVQIAENSLPQN